MLFLQRGGGPARIAREEVEEVGEQHSQQQHVPPKISVAPAQLIKEANIHQHYKELAATPSMFFAQLGSMAPPPPVPHVQVQPQAQAQASAPRPQQILTTLQSIGQLAKQAGEEVAQSMINWALSQKGPLQRLAIGATAAAEAGLGAVLGDVGPILQFIGMVTAPEIGEVASLIGGPKVGREAEQITYGIFNAPWQFYKGLNIGEEKAGLSMGTLNVPILSNVYQFVTGTNQLTPTAIGNIAGFAALLVPGLIEGGARAGARLAEVAGAEGLADVLRGVAEGAGKFTDVYLRALPSTYILGPIGTTMTRTGVKLMEIAEKYPALGDLPRVFGGLLITGGTLLAPITRESVGYELRMLTGGEAREVLSRYMGVTGADMARVLRSSTNILSTLGVDPGALARLADELERSSGVLSREATQRLFTEFLGPAGERAFNMVLPNLGGKLFAEDIEALSRVGVPVAVPRQGRLTLSPQNLMRGLSILLFPIELRPLLSTNVEEIEDEIRGIVLGSKDTMSDKVLTTLKYLFGEEQANDLVPTLKAWRNMVNNAINNAAPQIRELLDNAVHTTTPVSLDDLSTRVADTLYYTLSKEFIKDFNTLKFMPDAVFGNIFGSLSRWSQDASIRSLVADYVNGKIAFPDLLDALRSKMLQTIADAYTNYVVLGLFIDMLIHNRATMLPTGVRRLGVYVPGANTVLPIYNPRTGELSAITESITNIGVVRNLMQNLGELASQLASPAARTIYEVTNIVSSPAFTTTVRENLLSNAAAVDAATRAASSSVWDILTTMFNRALREEGLGTAASGVFSYLKAYDVLSKNPQLATDLVNAIFEALPEGAAKLQDAVNKVFNKFGAYGWGLTPDEAATIYDRLVRNVLTELKRAGFDVEIPPEGVKITHISDLPAKDIKAITTAVQGAIAPIWRAWLTKLPSGELFMVYTGGASVGAKSVIAPGEYLAMAEELKSSPFASEITIPAIHITEEGGVPRISVSQITTNPEAAIKSMYGQIINNPEIAINAPYYFHPFTPIQTLTNVVGEKISKMGDLANLIDNILSELQRAWASAAPEDVEAMLGWRYGVPGWFVNYAWNELNSLLNQPTQGGRRTTARRIAIAR